VQCSAPRPRELQSSLDSRSLVDRHGGAVGEREEQVVAFELDGEEEQEDDERARASIA